MTISGPNEPPQLPPLTDPVGLLIALNDRYGSKKVRGITNVVLLLAILLLVAAAVALIANLRYAVFGTLIAIFVLPFMQFFGERDKRQRSRGQQVFEFSSLVIGISSMGLLVASAFGDWPVPLRAAAFGDLNPDIPVPLPADLQTISLDVKAIDKPPEWIYPAAKAGDDTGRERGKMGKWLLWCSAGAVTNGGAKLIEASWTAGFPGYHHFSAKLRCSEVDKKHYVITDGVTFVVDNKRASDNVVAFRQYPLVVSEANPETVDPMCEFKEVSPGDKLYFLLRVIPSEGKLPSNYDIWLEKQ